MIHYIIVEDEDPGANVLYQILSSHCKELKYDGRAASVKQAAMLIREKNPELIFLDVELPDGTGIDLLREFGNRTFKVIFTTAHDHYALAAIKFAAIDFLLKPLSIEETKAAVEKVLQQSQSERMEQLIKSPDSGKHKRLALPTQEGFAFIEVGDLVYLTAEGSYSVLHTEDGMKFVVSKSLKEYEELLEPHGFFRIHHSHMVQLGKIRKYVKGNGGYVVMKNGLSLDVSARRKEEFMRLLSDMK